MLAAKVYIFRLAVMLFPKIIRIFNDMQKEIDAMSVKRLFTCLALCAALLFGTISVPSVAAVNRAGYAAFSYTDWSRQQGRSDWDDWKDFWEEWSRSKDWPDWQNWKESGWNKWPGWYYCWYWLFGFNWVQWWNSRSDGNKSVPVITDPPYYYDEIDDYNLYFGHLSAHSSLSDGEGSLKEAYRHARDDAGLDFFAVTDDSGMFDNAAEATLADGSKSSEWTGGKAIADTFTDSRFVAIFGYEMAWNNGNGHINTFNTNGFETAGEAAFSRAGGLLNYYNKLKKHTGSISQFNHPGKEHGDFHDFNYYDGEIDALVSLIEAGNGEGAVGSDKYYRSYDYYTRALDKGWHLAPTNNQDNRSANFGDANTARTVILAKKLTRDDLYDAMRNRRVYATEDENLEIRYTLNGHIMGSIVNTTSDEVRIRVKLKESGSETIGKVSVISKGGEIVTSQTLAVQSYTLDLTLPADRPYYYIRVDQFDKDIAVTAPIWVVKGSSNSGISGTHGIILDCSNKTDKDKTDGNKDKKDKNAQKKDEAVRNVCDLINKSYTNGQNISQSAVKAARDAYNKLKEDQKKQVDNYWKLVAAENWKVWEEYRSKNNDHSGKKAARQKE